MGGDGVVGEGGVVGVIPKAKRNAIVQSVLFDISNKQRKMVPGQLGEAHHKRFGDTTDYFQIYSIHINIYIPSVSVQRRGFYNI